jgi:8-oxo-dGTP pyrophosphatase MutT (NUDIX family)
LAELRTACGLSAYDRPIVEEIHREAARLLVRAADGAVLLLRLEPGIESPFWVTPGGGLDDGETYEAAARRELREEVGVELQIGPCVWHRHVTFTWDRWRVFQRERTFLVDVPEHFEAVVVHPDQEPITGWAWFLPDEIRAMNEVAYPRGLPDLLDDLATAGIPDAPIDLGFIVDD